MGISPSRGNSDLGLVFYISCLSKKLKNLRTSNKNFFVFAWRHCWKDQRWLFCELSPPRKINLNEMEKKSIPKKSLIDILKKYKKNEFFFRKVNWFPKIIQAKIIQNCIYGIVLKFFLTQIWRVLFRFYLGFFSVLNLKSYSMEEELNPFIRTPLVFWCFWRFGAFSLILDLSPIAFYLRVALVIECVLDVLPRGLGPGGDSCKKRNGNFHSHLVGIIYQLIRTAVKTNINGIWKVEFLLLPKRMPRQTGWRPEFIMWFIYTDIKPNA